MEKHVQTTTRLVEGALTLSVNTTRDGSRYEVGATGAGSIRSAAQGMSLTEAEATTLYRMLAEFVGPQKATPSGGVGRP